MAAPATGRQRAEGGTAASAAAALDEATCGGELGRAWRLLSGFTCGAAARVAATISRIAVIADWLRGAPPWRPLPEGMCSQS